MEHHIARRIKAARTKTHIRVIEMRSGIVCQARPDADQFHLHASFTFYCSEVHILVQTRLLFAPTSLNRTDREVLTVLHTQMDQSNAVGVDS